MPKLLSNPVMQRRPANLILTPGDVPYHPLLGFNVGVTRCKGRYVMAFRNDYSAADTVTCLATAGVNYLLALCRRDKKCSCFQEQHFK
jgi:hypothetical protein